MNISKEVWEELHEVLAKHKISYTTHYEKRDIQRAMEYPDITVEDKHIHISLVIPGYYESEGE